MKRRSGAMSIIASGMLTALLLGLIGVRFDWYFDLNDDFLMDRILNGAYTGRPETRNIQSLYPLTVLLSGFFSVIRSVDWYAVFLFGMQALCIFLVLHRILHIGRHTAVHSAAASEAPSGRSGRILRRCVICLWLLLALALVLGELLYHLVFVQYSVTVGMMAAAVIFLVMTEDLKELRGIASGQDLSGGKRAWHIIRVSLWKMLPEILLVLVGFALRSEMMVFLSPFIALAVVIRGVQVFCFPRHCFRKLCIFVLTAGMAMLLGCGVLKAVDLAAYSSPAWRSFETFFDARTQLYDFEHDWMKSYDDDRAYYDSIGLDRSEVELLWNYNFGLDERITADVVQKVADHAAQNAAAEDPAPQRLREALYDYRVRLSAAEERPYNMIAAVLYGLVVLQAFFGLFESGIRSRIGAAAGAGRSSGVVRCVLTLLAAAAVFALRSAEYIYLLYHHRPVARLTHCLYLCEAVILLCLFFAHTLESRRKAALGAAVSLLLVLTMALSSVMQYRSTAQEYARREEVNQRWTSLLSYVQEHPENYYFIDVYSTVDFSEKMFDNNKVMVSNWDFAGGWAAKSPLWDRKLADHGMSSMAEGLVNSDAVFFVSAVDRDVDWIPAWYASQGREVEMKTADRIGNDFIVYRVAAQ